MREGAFRGAKYLPSENDLAKRMDVSRTQLRDALARLEREGFISRRHGVGTMINRHVLALAVRMDLEVEFLEMVISKIRLSRPDDGRASDNTGRIMCWGEENPLIGSSFHCTATTTSKVTASTNSGRAPRIAMPKIWEVRDFLPATTARIRGHTNSKAISVATIV